MSRFILGANPVRDEAVHAGERAAPRPRVLHLITSFEVGGTERQAVELIKRIDRDRFDVRLAALRNEGPFYRELAARFPAVPEFRLTSFYNLNAIKQLARLRALMLRERIDILHAHDFYSGLIGAAAARVAGVRVIAAQRHLKLSDRALHEWGTRVIHRLAHRILVNSEAIRDHIVASRSAHARKIVVIRNGVAAAVETSETLRASVRDEICRELGIANDVKLIGVVARLQPVKGHRFLVEAARLILKDHPKAHFIFIGDGPLKGEIENLAERSGVRDHIHLLGERADVGRLVASMNLVALASLHEGSPNAVIEAMAAGVPVVATGVGGIKELITDGETGYLAAPGDAQSLARCISLALTDDEGRRGVASRGHGFIMTKFSMRRMVDSVEKLYRELMK